MFSKALNQRAVVEHNLNKKVNVFFLFPKILINKMAIDRRLLNVVLLGFGFMFVFTAFQTMGNIQKTVLDSISEDDPSFKGDGYTSLAIVYAVFAIFNWFAPPLISMIGPKITMLIGAVTYLLFIMSFLIPKTWLLYLASVVIGVGAAAIWTGQGNYLTLNSSPSTISRNSGIFWALLQASLFIGNLYVYFQFQGLTHIDEKTRDIVTWVLSGIAVVGIVFLLILPKSRPSSDSIEEVQQGPIETFKGAGRLFLTKRMLLLTITFLYTGLELSFFSGVYSPSIGFTKQFGDQAKQLVGLSGILIGTGEVVGGMLFGIFGNKMTKWGRDPIVMGGYLIHVIAFFLIFLNLPDKAPFNDTDDKAFITSSAPLAIFCSFMLGFGDACFNTQIYAMIGSVYADNSASAFALFKFSQSVAAACSFFYSSQVGLYIQLGILLVFATVGTICFVLVEWAVKKENKSKIPADSESVSTNE